MMTHSMRSTFMLLAAGEPGMRARCAARSPRIFSNTALAPGTQSLRANFIGPLPMYSVICLNGSVLAMRSGMMKAHRRVVLAEREQHLRDRASDSTHLKVRSSTAVSSLLQGLDHQAHGVAGAPAGEARHHVLGQHRLAVVELEAGPQLEGPGQAVGSRPPRSRPSAASAAACRRRRRACPRPAPRRCARRTGCPRWGRSWRGWPAARTAGLSRLHPARSPARGTNQAPPGCPCSPMS